MHQLKPSLFEEIEETPREHYTFAFTAEEVSPVRKAYTWNIVKRMLLSLLLLAVVILYIVLAFRGSAGYEGLLGFFIGCAFLDIAMFIKTLYVSKKAWEKADERLPSNLYDYSMYQNFFIIWISSPTGVRQKKVQLQDVKKAQTVKNLLVLEIDQQLFFLRQDALIENSAFLHLGKPSSLQNPQPKTPTLTREEIIIAMRDKDLGGEDVVEVFYSKDQTKRFVVYRNKEGLYSYGLEWLTFFDEEEWQYIRRSHPKETLPAMWESAYGTSARSLFGTKEEALKELFLEPAYITHFA